MNDDELFRRYKIMTDPPPRWRRWLGMALLAVFVATYVAVAYFLNAAVHGPFWGLAVGAAAGLLAGGLLARSNFNLPHEGWRRSLTFVAFYLALFSSEKLILWLAHEHDSGAFFFAYFIAVTTGGMIGAGAILFRWSSFSKPRPLIP